MRPDDIDDQQEDVGIPPNYPLEDGLEHGLSKHTIEPKRIKGPIGQGDFDDSDESGDPEDDSIATLIPRLTPRQQRFAIALLDTVGVVTVAAMQAGTSWHTVKKWQAEDPVFAFAFAEIKAYTTGLHEAALVQAATIGIKQPIFQGGVRVGWKRVKDVRAMELLLKAKMPEEYGDREQDPATMLQRIATDTLKETVRDTMKKLLTAASQIAEQKVKVKRIGGKVIE